MKWLKRLLYVLLMGGVLALWIWGPYRTIEKPPCEVYRAMIGGIKVDYPASVIRQAGLAGESLEVVMGSTNQVLWRGSVADFMTMVVDSVAYEEKGER